MRLNDAGIAAAGRGDFALAIKLYEAALAKIPGDAVIQKNLQNARAARDHTVRQAVEDGLHQTGRDIANIRGAPAESLNFSNSASGPAGTGGLHFSRGGGHNNAFDQAVATGEDAKRHSAPAGPNDKPQSIWDTPGTIRHSGDGVFIGGSHTVQTPVLQNQQRIVAQAQKREAQAKAALDHARASPAPDTATIEKLEKEWKDAHNATRKAQSIYSQLANPPTNPSQTIKFR